MECVSRSTPPGPIVDTVWGAPLPKGEDEEGTHGRWEDGDTDQGPWGVDELASRGHRLGRRDVRESKTGGKGYSRPADRGRERRGR